MNRAALNRRLLSLEVQHENRRTGAELYARMPRDPRNHKAYIMTLTDDELDEVRDYVKYLKSVLPPSPPDPELERFSNVDLTTLTDAEFEQYIADLDAFINANWERYAR